jgi:hypothetical protein
VPVSTPAAVLVRPLARSTAWAPLLVLPALTVAITLLSTRHGVADPIGQARLAMVLLAVAMAPVLDEPAHELVIASPTSLGRCRRWRIALGVAPVAAAWLVVLARVRLDAGTAAAVSLELAATLATVLAVAVVVARRNRDGMGGLEAAMATPVVAGLVSALPDRWTLLAGSPHSPAWTDSHRRWAVLFAAAVAVLATDGRKER